MKKFVACITIAGLLLSSGAFADEDCCMPEPSKVYYDETEDCFNKGKFVGKESEDYLKSLRFARNRNWGLATGATALGILTLVLVGKHHRHHNRDHSHPQPVINPRVE